MERPWLHYLERSQPLALGRPCSQELWCLRSGVLGKFCKLVFWERLGPWRRASLPAHPFWFCLGGLHGREGKGGKGQGPIPRAVRPGQEAITPEPLVTFTATLLFSLPPRARTPQLCEHSSSPETAFPTIPVSIYYFLSLFPSPFLHPHLSSAGPWAQPF